MTFMRWTSMIEMVIQVAPTTVIALQQLILSRQIWSSESRTMFRKVKVEEGGKSDDFWIELTPVI